MGAFEGGLCTIHNFFWGGWGNWGGWEIKEFGGIIKNSLNSLNSLIANNRQKIPPLWQKYLLHKLPPYGRGGGRRPEKPEIKRYWLFN